MLYTILYDCRMVDFDFDDIISVDGVKVHFNCLVLLVYGCI